MRRAEFEARHAEALQRAKSQARFQLEPSNPYFRHRLSKSATTSPIATPALRPGLTLGPPEERGGYFGVSSERDWHPSLDEREEKKSRRRLSGPWHPSSTFSYHQPNHPNLLQSRSSGHLVDQIRPAGASYGGHHTVWPHPYHPQPPHAHHRHSTVVNTHDDSPSPISSDSETHTAVSQSPSRGLFQINPISSSLHQPHPHSSDQSPPHYSAMRTTSAEFSHNTPSTSPFLGPLRTLNIHSTDPSRAPSPVLLPPPTFEGRDRERDITDDVPSGSRRPSLAGSPTNSSISMHHHRPVIKHPRRKESLGYAMPALPHPNYHLSSHGTSSSSGVPTPQLSSGPSSSGSSPGSLAQHTPLGPPPLLPLGSGINNGSSTTSSRAPSPVAWTQALAAGQMSAIHGKREHSHSNLAHSVRVAFGMTPILPSPPKTTTTARTIEGGSGGGALFGGSGLSHPVSGVTTPMYPHSLSTNLWGLRSMPGSRSGSPPITLPPLKVPQHDAGGDERSSGEKNGDNVNVKKEDEDDSMEVDKKLQQRKEKVELPGFSEFEAAARGLVSPPPSSQKMSIDFVR